MGRDAQMAVRIERRRFSEAGFNWNGRTKLTKIYVVLVNGRRIDSFLKRRNAEAKARRLRCQTGYID